MPPRSFPWNKSNHDGTATNEEAMVSQSQPPDQRSSSPVRAHLAAVVSEFTGTFLFLFFALGGAHVVNSTPSTTPANQDPAKLLYISLCFGLSLAVNVWAFFRIEGGMFNPAVAVAMFATGGIDILRLVLIIAAQLVGSIAASGLVVGLLPGNGIQARTSLGDGMSVARGFFLELFLTAQLVLAIFMLAVEKHQSTAVAPIGIGLALFIAHMVGIFYTGSSLNPARSFGPEVVTIGGFPHYHWIYWIGPILGALLAAGFYKLVKTLEFDRISPGIDEPAWLHEHKIRHRSHVSNNAGTDGSSHDQRDMA